VGNTGAVRVEVLGPIRVVDGGGLEVTPTGALQRRLLALLVLHRGDEVTSDEAIEALWPTAQPRDAAAALQTHLSRLRAALPPDLIASTPSGYRLDARRVEVDSDALALVVNAWTAGTAGGAREAIATIDRALDRWRGGAYPELADTDDGRIAADRLQELQRRALEARAEARLQTGATEALAVDLGVLVDAEPLRERPRALLVEALVAEGRTVEALRVYDEFRRLLGEELGVEPSPTFAARHAELVRGSMPAWRPEHRLPGTVTSLVGRGELIDEVLEATNEHRLVTLVGPGGVGKTRLAIELGHRLRVADAARPVVFCELATADEFSALDVVAAALGIDRRMEVALDERIAAVIADAEVVVVLDNCEHVLDVAAALAERLLQRCPHVMLVATTRERLRIAGERLCPVPPLPALEAEGPAAQLFVERARAVSPGFAPSDPERAVIGDIARRLDGLPLAIELAAARLHTMDVDEIAAGLDHRFRLLSAGSRTASRHRSLGAAVAWSHAMLDEEVQTTFDDLSVFAGSFTIGDASAVCGIDVAAVAVTLDLLTERSLVMRTTGRRFMLLETLRAYGVEQRQRRNRAEVASRRHAQHLLEWARHAAHRLLVDDGVDVMGEIESTLPELRVAFSWLLDQHDVELAGRLVLSLEHYGFLRLRPDVLGWSDRVIAADPDDRGPMASDMWAQSSVASWMAGDIVTTRQRVERALALAALAGGDLPPTVRQMAGSSALFEGRLGDAVDWYDQAIAADPDDRAHVLVASGTRVLALGYAEHPTAPTEAEHLLRLVGDERTAYSAFAWYCAGEALLHDQPAVARQRLDRALVIAAQTGTSFVIGVAGTSRASLDARVGDPIAAAEEFRALLVHWRLAGMWSTQWTTLRAIAQLLDRLGRYRDSAVLAGAVLATHEGHRVFGEDEIALRELIERLERSLGPSEFGLAYAEGPAPAGPGPADHALRAL
jgi:predicted ATPase/DNA-binding SARP family transcriptional activator